MRPRGTARAIGRSLRVYHGPDAPKAAMDALHARFVKPGDLVFDIGAHVGDRVSSFRRLGARVVALEPQPGPLRALRLIHGRDLHVTLVPMACGAHEGETTFRINSANPTVSTASPAFIAAAAGAEGWKEQVWDMECTVPMTTLDALIKAHGLPRFVKIDVEGFEADVLAGLSRVLPIISFELTTIQRDVALRCIEILERLGPWRYNLALGESQDMAHPGFVGKSDMAACIEGLHHGANSGDVYCMAAMAGTGASS